VWHRVKLDGNRKWQRLDKRRTNDKAGEKQKVNASGASVKKAAWDKQKKRKVINAKYLKTKKNNGAEKRITTEKLRQNNVSGGPMTEGPENASDGDRKGHHKKHNGKKEETAELSKATPRTCAQQGSGKTE